MESNPDKPWDYCILSMNTFNGRKYDITYELFHMLNSTYKEKVVTAAHLWNEHEQLSRLPLELIEGIMGIDIQ